MTPAAAPCSDNGRWPWLAAALLAGGYFLGAEVGRWLSLPDSKAVTFWLPSGVFVSALLLNHTRRWPLLAVAAMVANLSFDLLHGKPLWVSGLFFAGNCLEGLIGAAMVRRWVAYRPALDSMGQVIAFVLLAALASPVISATVGTFTLHLAYNLPFKASAWLVWWIGDALGVLAAAPLLLCGPEWRRVIGQPRPRDRIEGAALATLLTACAWLVFNNRIAVALEDDYLLLPLLIWTAFRFGLPGIALANLGLSIMGIHLALTGANHAGPPVSIAHQVISTQALMAVYICTMLPLTALLHQRQCATDVLRTAKEHFRLLLDSLPNIAVQGYGPDGTIHYWNRASQTIYGYTAQEAIGKNLIDLIIPASMRKEVTMAIEHGAKTGIMPPAAELNLMRKDGSLTPVYSSHAVIDSPEQGRLMLCVDVDMTEINRLREQLLMSHRMETVGRLTGGISHDFNNLLAVISGYTESLARRLPEDSPLLLQVNEIDNATQRGRLLTRQLMEFSAGQAAERVVLDLNQIIARIYQMLRQVISTKIDIVLHKEIETAIVRADPSQMEQMLMNLALNARDAMPEGGTLSLNTAAVELTAYEAEQRHLPPGRYIKLAAHDTGCGMDESTQARIFEPFFTTKGHSGRGLGLSIVYGIVRHSGGAISVDSHTGQGTTFEVLLPQAAETGNDS